ncbi:MAG: hypothetical protein IH897_07250 [Planctomycetes bacterium]|nr:hypothetical protein [Planctomycetota bacterium]
MLDSVPSKMAKHVSSRQSEWESRPFVEFLTELKKHSATHPFVSERIAWLKLSYDSGASKKILARRDPPKGEQFVKFQLVLLKGLASKDNVVDAHLRFLNENGSKLFQSSTQQQVRDAAWRNFDQAIRVQDGQPIFVEIWDENTFSDSLLGLFVVYPSGQTTRYETEIIWNVHERKPPTIRVGIAKVKLAFAEEK